MLMACGALAACTTVDEKPQPVRDLRGNDVRDQRRDPPPARAEPGGAPPLAGTPQNVSEQRRRASIRLELATGYYQQGNYQQALEELRSALSTDPGYAQAYGMLGLVYMDMNDRSRAEESFQRALRLDRGMSPPEVLTTMPGERWAEESGLDERQYIIPGGGGFGELMNNSWV
jgi:tetratricopeptide (TPR) repeat protein